MSPKLKTYQICFSHRYRKLKPLNMRFTTVRWLDSVYRLGHVYEIFYVVPNAFHRKIHLGSARLIKLEIKRMNELNDVFTRMDADCNYITFCELMRGWYEQKKDPAWKGDHSEIQVLYLERVFQSNEKDIQDQLTKTMMKQEPLEVFAQ